MDSEKARAVAQQFGRGQSTREKLFNAFLRMGQYIDDRIRDDSPMGKLRKRLQETGKKKPTE